MTFIDSYVEVIDKHWLWESTEPVKRIISSLLMCSSIMLPAIKKLYHAKKIAHRIVIEKGKAEKEWSSYV